MVLGNCSWALQVCLCTQAWTTEPDISSQDCFNRNDWDFYFLDFVDFVNMAVRFALIARRIHLHSRDGRLSWHSLSLSVPRPVANVSFYTVFFFFFPSLLFPLPDVFCPEELIYLMSQKLMLGADFVLKCTTRISLLLWKQNPDPLQKSLQAALFLLTKKEKGKKSSIWTASHSFGLPSSPRCEPLPWAGSISRCSQESLLAALVIAMSCKHACTAVLCCQKFKFSLSTVPWQGWELKTEAELRSAVRKKSRSMFGKTKRFFPADTQTSVNEAWWLLHRAFHCLGFWFTRTRCTGLFLSVWRLNDNCCFIEN